MVYCVDKDADIFEELYNARLVRGLVIENRVDELFGLRNIQRTLYDCIGRGVQLVRIFYSEQSTGMALG